jgi:hypothetical protein
MANTDPMLVSAPTIQTGTMPSALPQVQPKGSGNGFWQKLGTVGSMALNFVAPGAGSLIGGLINRGGGLDTSNMEAMLQKQAESSMLMLGIQTRVQSQTQEFTTVSNLLKARHDGEMSAVNNFKS